MSESVQWKSRKRDSYTLTVTVEAKDETTPEGAEPHLPSVSELSGYINDVLADETKHNAAVGWRVVAVV